MKTGASINKESLWDWISELIGNRWRRSARLLLDGMHELTLSHPLRTTCQSSGRLQPRLPNPRVPAPQGQPGMGTPRKRASPLSQELPPAGSDPGFILPRFPRHTAESRGWKEERTAPLPLAPSSMSGPGRSDPEAVPLTHCPCWALLARGSRSDGHCPR